MDFGKKLLPFQLFNPLNHFGRKWKFVAHCPLETSHSYKWEGGDEDRRKHAEYFD